MGFTAEQIREMTPSQRASAVRWSKWGFLCGGVACVCFCAVMLIQLFIPNVSGLVDWKTGAVALYALWMFFASMQNLKVLGVKLNG